MVLGIPRALLYWKYSVFMETFFKECGLEVIVSPETNKEILDNGSKYCVDEACLPVKIFHGHVYWLKDKCDAIFIPRIMQTNKREYICPKFCGLPEMIKNSIPGMPFITMDPIYAATKKELFQSSRNIALNFINNRGVIQKAFDTAYEKQKNYNPGFNDNGYKMKVGILGHPYNIYDSFSNMNIIKKLHELGIGIITEEHVDEELINNSISKLFKKPFWTFARNAYGASSALFQNNSVDGLIYISSFACGIDSVVIELIKEEIGEFPMLILKVDEHSGEAGLETRVEAFVDMLERRLNNESKPSKPGNSYLAAKALFDDLGIQCVVPKPSNKVSLELGSLHFPEEICLPFKIMIGNYLEAIKEGADTIIITGSCGPCRYGEYCELQMNILKKLGHKIDIVVIDSPHDIGMNEFLNRIYKISNKSCKSKLAKINALRNAFKIVKLIDNIEADLRYKSGYEKHQGACKKLLKECKTHAMKSKSGEEMISILNRYRKMINNIEIDKAKRPIKIAIVGEIYAILEPFANLYIEDKLMDLGVSSWRGLTPSWWVKNMILSSVNMNSLDIKKASKPYLSHYIGGHGRECIGEVMLAQKEGYDGVIQIFPFGCMPEIVAKSILPTISKDKDLPIMTLVVDELTGEAGYMTRIEAFLDMIDRRKRKCSI